MNKFIYRSFHSNCELITFITIQKVHCLYSVVFQSNTLQFVWFIVDFYVTPIKNNNNSIQFYYRRLRMVLTFPSVPKRAFGNGILLPFGSVCVPRSTNSIRVPSARNLSAVQLTILSISPRLSGHAETDFIATASRNVSIYRVLFASTCLQSSQRQKKI